MLEGLQTSTIIKLLNNSQLERLDVPMFDIEFMNEIGHEIKESKIQYEKTIEDTTKDFEDSKKEIMNKLGWNNVDIHDKLI